MAALAPACLSGAPAHAAGAEPATIQADVSEDGVAVPAQGVLPTLTVRAARHADVSAEETGLYTHPSSRSATGLKLSPRQTPQTLSTLTRTQMNDFGLTNAKQALAMSGGVLVEEVETERTFYTARGFQITNLLTDGMGQPFAYGNAYGDMDTAVYDRIDVVYGATGLMSGSGYPAATINFVRKRPTETPRTSVGLTASSWQGWRADADLSRPLNDSGSVRGRLVAARESGGSHLDRYSRDKSVLYGVVEAELTADTLATLGWHRQRIRIDSPTWGGIPFVYADGSATHFDTSASTSADWSWWDAEVGSVFGELQHDFDADWRGTLRLTRQAMQHRNELFYVSGALDAASGLGLSGMPTRYRMDESQRMADAQLQGKLPLWGRRHDVALAMGWARSRLEDGSVYGATLPVTIGQVLQGSAPRPAAYDAAPPQTGDVTDQRRHVQLATRWHVADTTRLILGARWTDVRISGASYDIPRDVHVSKTTPYVGIVQELSPQWSAYASHTRIFQPQSELGADLRNLAPVTGRTSELGLKGELLGKQLNTSLAVFRTDQQGLAEYAGMVGSTYVYAGRDIASQGLQADIAGQLAEGWQLNAGYTGLSLRTLEDAQANTHTPRHVLRLSTTWRPAMLPKAKLGAALSWQSETRASYGTSTIRQDAYALLNLMASYDIQPQLTARLQVDNVTDQRHIAGMHWAAYNMGLYGAPRRLSASLTWTQ
ncbi:MAG: TonB-dependent siderophore receptor [Aquabacterium sp.]